MEFSSSKTPIGWTVMTCMVLAVLIVRGSLGCSPMPMDFGTSVNAEIDTVAHIPLANVTAKGMTHCMQICSRAALCNIINFEREKKTCLLFDIADAPGATKTPAATWMAISFVRLTTVPKFPFECEPNLCEAGTQCVENEVGPICATLDLTFDV